MRHGDVLGKLNRDPVRRQRLLRTLAAHLFTHERIQTTLARGKELVRYADKIITLGKRSLLRPATSRTGEASRLKVFERVMDPTAGSKVLTVLAERYAQRSGGYTRLWRAGNREGDRAPVAIVELVDNPNDLRKHLQSLDEKRLLQNDASANK